MLRKIQDPGPRTQDSTDSHVFPLSLPRLLAFYVLCIFLCSISSTVRANEALQIAGMGGAFAGLRSVEGGIFGNPSGLTNIQNNNLSVSLSAQNLDYEGLPLSEDEQMNTWVSFRLRPSIYYSRVIKGVGIGLGYEDDVDNRSTIRVETTKAEYIADERKFNYKGRIVTR